MHCFYTPGIYAEGYIVFVFPFICSSIRMFVISSRSWNYFQVLLKSNSSGVYLTNQSSESIHFWTIGTLRGGSHSMTPDPRVHAPARGQNLEHLLKVFFSSPEPKAHKVSL